MLLCIEPPGHAGGAAAPSGVPAGSLHDDSNLSLPTRPSSCSGQLPTSAARLRRGAKATSSRSTPPLVAAEAASPDEGFAQAGWTSPGLRAL